jgi:hypothetical protein
VTRNPRKERKDSNILRAFGAADVAPTAAKPKQESFSEGSRKTGSQGKQNRLPVLLRGFCHIVLPASSRRGPRPAPAPPAARGRLICARQRNKIANRGALPLPGENLTTKGGDKMAVSSFVVGWITVTIDSLAKVCRFAFDRDADEPETFELNFSDSLKLAVALGDAVSVAGGTKRAPVKNVADTNDQVI